MHRNAGKPARNKLLIWQKAKKWLKIRIRFLFDLNFRISNGVWWKIARSGGRKGSSGKPVGGKTQGESPSKTEIDRRIVKVRDTTERLPAG